MNDWLVDGRELKPTEIKRAAWESQTRKWNSYQGLENWKYHHCHLPHLLEGDAGTKQETTTCRRNLLFNYHVRDRPEINVMSEIRQPKHYKLSHSHSPVCCPGVFLSLIATILRLDTRADPLVFVEWAATEIQLLFPLNMKNITHSRKPKNCHFHDFTYVKKRQPKTDKVHARRAAQIIIQQLQACKKNNVPCGTNTIINEPILNRKQFAAINQKKKIRVQKVNISKIQQKMHPFNVTKIPWCSVSINEK